MCGGVVAALRGPRRHAWQSDLPNATNRGFIQDALERAAKDIRKDEEIGIDPSIDRDTQGVPGSPNIVATIFEKIGRADVFVADVSFITPPGYGGGRPPPSPNVLIELGYAAHCHGWNRIRCVFNAATGRVEDLPFDIRQHSITGYSLAEGQEKSETRKALVAQPRDKITDSQVTAAIYPVAGRGVASRIAPTTPATRPGRA